jgi:osmotically-inducible protein OsmY
MRKTRIGVVATMLLAGASLSACVEAVLLGGTAAVVGATAAQDRGVKGATSDLGIRAEIVNAWTTANSVFLRDLNLQVYEGRVLVSGEVANEELRAQAIQLAWKAGGVREVLNEVEVGTSGGLRTYLVDSRIVRELEGKMLFEKGVSSLNFSIESFNANVFIIGVAQDQVELNRVLQLARGISGVKKVVPHVLMKDDPRRFRTAPA